MSVGSRLLVGVFPFLLALAGLSLGPTRARARPQGWPAPTDADVIRDGAMIQITRTMALDLPADADAAFPLFGPVREAEWSPEWKPAFIAPNPATQSADGAVFTTGAGNSPTTWVMTDYDPGRHIVRYVHVRPGQVVTQLWIEVSSSSARGSRADVTYRLTALSTAGRDLLAHFAGAFSGFKAHWEEAIGAALRGEPPRAPAPR